MAFWDIAEQQNIKPLDITSANKVFPQLQREVEANDLQSYLGFEFYQELKRNTSNYTKLLDGGEYQVGGVTYTFSGLKYVCAYLLYARYVKQSYVKDTFSGFVKHTGDGFQSISAGEIKNQAAEYEQVAGSYWEECKHYLDTLSLPYFPEKKSKTFKFDAL